LHHHHHDHELRRFRCTACPLTLKKKLDLPSLPHTCCLSYITTKPVINFMTKFNQVMTLKLKNELKNDKLFHIKYYLDNRTDIHMYNLVRLHEKCTCTRLLPTHKNPWLSTTKISRYNSSQIIWSVLHSTHTHTRTFALSCTCLVTCDAFNILRSCKCGCSPYGTL